MSQVAERSDQVRVRASSGTLTDATVAAVHETNASVTRLTGAVFERRFPSFVSPYEIAAASAGLTEDAIRAALDSE